ncbi:MAG: ATP-dependent zinc protease [Succinivibrio sp.]
MKKIKSSLAIFFLSLGLSANGTDNNDLNDRLTKLRGTVDSINGELTSQRASIGSIRADIEQSNQLLRRQILEELKAVQRQNQFVYDTLVAERERSGEKMKIKPLRNYDLETPDNKMILGGSEYVYVKEADATIEARIDTGASQSSISAKDITEFERNGKKWLRFKLIHNDRSIDMEAMYVKQIRLLQSSTDDFSYRPVVKLNIKIGDYSTVAEFNLIDRSKMQFALLIGRNILTDIAVVDVSRRLIQKRADKDGLLIISTDEYVANVKQGINLNEKYDLKIKNGRGEQNATLASDGSESLGTNPEKALPAVSNKIAEEQGSKPQMKSDKKTVKEKPVKAHPEAGKNSKVKEKKTSVLAENSRKKLQ